MAQPKPLSAYGKATFLLCALGANLCRAAMADPSNPPANTSAPAPVTNQVQAVHFPVNQYQIDGNTLLTDLTLNSIFSKHVGTNMTFDDVASGVKELQLEYHNRGYDTVSVTIPQQRLTNGIFRIRVFEGRLANVIVRGNHYYSSNNVMRQLPGLHTNMFLNTRLLQPQLDLANANQDRQIYPEIHPGPDSNTTDLILRVKDRFPMHGKIEANNQSTPGTPDLRLATSAVYDNLWQLDQSLGVQYTFSEVDYKQNGNWNFYDLPLVANYSGFYRLPLAAPEDLGESAARGAGHFGYNEATRKFELPPATGAPELNIYASGSTIDTGIIQGSSKTLFSGTNGTIAQQTVHQDLTYNDALGFRLTQPWPDFLGFHPHMQVGLDYKSYKQVSFETNDFIFTQYLVDTSGRPYTRVSVTPSPVPTTSLALAYLPITFHWDASRDDPSGFTTVAFNYSPNLWFSGTREGVAAVTGSPEANGFWHVITANASREQNLPGNYKVALRADGQWASQPLIANEQFGAGGVTGVRGYREGEVFGDTGWRVTSEFKLPQYRVGFAGQGTGRPLMVRASFFMDYADTYLLDPQGRSSATPLWGTGFAGAASLGPHFNGSLGFAWPLLSTPTTEAYHVRITFALSAQF